MGLYIHIPFCKTICVYCNFLTFANKSTYIETYVEALKKEIQLKSEKFRDYQVNTIYFGGGTPSLIDKKFIKQIIDSLKIHFNIHSNAEISIECNPESLNTEKIQYFQKIGINRISLGIQSLNRKTLWKVARPHNEIVALQVLKELKDSNFTNYGCDLIMGLPYQTLEEFKKHIDIILSFNPKHLSAYFLSYDTKRIDTFIKDSPKEEEQVKMYQFLIKKLKKEKFIHYEVSNYAKKGFECKHNIKYWNQEEYLGLGLGGHSFINNEVSENIRNFEHYLQNPLLIEEKYKLNKDIKRMDFIMLSLRQKNGINLNKYKKLYGENQLQILLKNAHQYIPKELKQTATHLMPSEQGFLILDRITKELI